MFGFKSFHISNRRIKVSEAMSVVVKNQTLGLTRDLMDQTKFIQKSFDIYALEKLRDNLSQ